MLKPRWLVLVLAWISTGLGILGIFLPLLPATPFLLLAAYGFSRSSPRFHHWLLRHPYLGPPVIDWQNRGVIRFKTKIYASAFMLISAAVATVQLYERPVLIGVMACSLLGAAIFIWSRPSH
jgi:uncharacterized protein